MKLSRGIRSREVMSNMILGLRHTYENETILKGSQLGEAVLDDRIQHMCEPDMAGKWGR